mgnify:CR=1 FL=1
MFTLTDALLRKILFSMENQTEEFVIFEKDGESSVEKVGEKKNSDPEELLHVPETAVYPLPSWSSSDGFNLLEEFVASVRFSKAQEELKAAVSGGRGVFRNFKDVLKKYPEISARFSRFKEKKMKSRIFEWYNALREEAGLSFLPLDGEEEKIDDLVSEDFSFSKSLFLTDEEKATVFLEHEKIAGEFEKNQEYGKIFSALWNVQRIFTEQSEGFVCRTFSGEFAGCVVYERFPQNSPTVARESVALTTCFVDSAYRGLGIARKLLSLCLDEFRRSAKASGIQHFFVADAMVSESFGRILLDLGFVRVRSIFVANFF